MNAAGPQKDATWSAEVRKVNRKHECDFIEMSHSFVDCNAYAELPRCGLPCGYKVESDVDLATVIAELRGMVSQKEGRVKLLAPMTRSLSPRGGRQLSPHPSIARDV